MHALAELAAAVCLCLAGAPAADATPFNGRIAFSSFRTDPAGSRGDIFTMNDDGSGLRQLTTNPDDDGQSDWSPDGRDIAYRIRKPGSPVNYEVARMTAHGADVRRLTFTPDGQASSQPSWLHDASAILARRSEPMRVAGIWRMGPLGESPAPAYDPPDGQLYPSAAPDMRTILFTTVWNASGPQDRAIQVLDAAGGEPRTLFDVAGAYDSAPAWSPDGARIAFESDADVAGANPERDLEIWVMDADGSDAVQLTHNALHDEGPAWSPDGTMLAYSSGQDNVHLGPSCRRALRLAKRWSRAGRPDRIGGFDATAEDFGGLWRVVLTQRSGDRGLVAFLAGDAA